jgi:peptidoglycan/xylan/chitin deacetylase (PgdA/CDA1 family)
MRTGISRSPSLADTLERSLDLEQARNVTASYFFTVPPHPPRSRYDCVYAPQDRCFFGGRVQRVVDVIRAIADRGFDVGLHGGYAAGSTPGVLTEERATLEAATGLEIKTTRQHFLRWDVRWTPLYQEAAGLSADSTMGFNFDVGFRSGTSLPFRLLDVASRRTLDLLEVPLIVQDGALLGATALGLDRGRAEALLREVFDTVSASGGVVTLVVHPDKLARPDWLALYKWVLDYGLEQGAWVTSLGDLCEWWRAREARILAG